MLSPTGDAFILKPIADVSKKWDFIVSKYTAVEIRDYYWDPSLGEYLLASELERMLSTFNIKTLELWWSGVPKDPSPFKYPKSVEINLLDRVDTMNIK
jgi:hypothetical protein